MSLDPPGRARPGLFGFGVGLAEWYRSGGVEPAALLGHRVGEYAAACVAGAVSVEDAARLVAARGRMMQGLPAGGAMAAVQAAVERVTEAIGADSAAVALAALNAADATERGRAYCRERECMDVCMSVVVG